MAPPILGRTNQTFPRVWLSLVPPQTADESHEALAAAARSTGLPIDVSRAPMLWGHSLRGDGKATLMQVSNSDIERAVSSSHAADLIQAHLIETLSAIGRDWIDFYFLRSRKVLKEAQISGALESLEMARQEGHIRHLGIYDANATSATMANWQLHDAFELICVGNDETPEGQSLLRMAAHRRAGVVTRSDNGSTSATGPLLVEVSTKEQIAALGVAA